MLSEVEACARAAQHVRPETPQRSGKNPDFGEVQLVSGQSFSASTS